MAACGTCGSFVLFGGKKAGGKRYCSAKCAATGVVAQVAAQVPPELVRDRVSQVHEGNCPVCKGPGPVDVHVSHRVISILVATRWSSRWVISCRSCGTKQRIGDAIYCFVLGWWGFPWGLAATPAQIIRNLVGLARAPDPTKPSPLLFAVVQRQLAQEAMGPELAGSDSTATAATAGTGRSARELVAK